MLLLGGVVYLRCAECGTVWDTPDRRRSARQNSLEDDRAADRALAALQQLQTLVQQLEDENAALRYAALTFGALAERLNIALRQEREKRPASDNV